MTKSCSVVLATIGSLGDLYPYLALAGGLASRGHRPTIAADPLHRSTVEGAGFAFHPVRPTISQFPPEEVLPLVTHPTRATEYIIRQLILPYLEETYRDFLPVAEAADFVVTHPLFYGVKLAVETAGTPWAVGALQPSIFFSVHDPPVIATALFAERLRFLGRPFYRLFFRVIWMVTRPWARPVIDLRRRLGLPEIPIDPLIDGQFSDQLTLALFSPMLAPPQPDWPANTVATGFPLYRDAEERPALPPELQEFLDAGDPPIVFTLGSVLVSTPGRFFVESVEAARALGRRSVLLVGQEGEIDPTIARSPDVCVVPFVPHRALFPRAAAIVHQGGIGTTAEALLAGRPMLIVPFVNDQPDNARRAVRLGVGRTIRPSRYRAPLVREELRRLLEEPKYAEDAQRVAGLLRGEDGAAAACDAIEKALERSLAAPQGDGRARGAPESKVGSPRR